jgi:uncharacterized membrane protein
MPETSINQISDKCGIPLSSLFYILRDAKEDKYHSTLFIHALKHGFDFYVYDRWNTCLNQNNRGKVISVVKKDWKGYAFQGD